METPPSSQSQCQVSTHKQWVRHPNDATVIPKGMSLLIEGRFLFEVDMARLRQQSIALNDILSIPSSLPLDGSPESPVAIPYISGEEFAHFVNWFNQQPWSSEQPSKAALLSILAISHRFMMDAGVEWAIRSLDSLKLEEAVTPSHRLQLGFRYKIEKWVIQAVDEIFYRQEGRKQLRLITTENIEQMGARTFVLFVKGIEAVQASRLSVALNVPTSYHTPQCLLSTLREQECAHALREFWRAVVPQLLLAADQPTPLEELAGFLRRTEIKNVDNSCKLLTLFHFEKAGVLTIEPNVRKHVATSIWDLYQEGYM